MVKGVFYSVVANRRHPTKGEEGERGRGGGLDQGGGGISSVIAKTAAPRAASEATV